MDSHSLVSIADEARLLYTWYPEAAAERIKATAALNDVWKAARRERRSGNGDGAWAGELDADISRQLKNAAGACEQCSRRIGDLAIAVARVFPDLWPQLRLVEVGAQWHKKADFDWDAAIGELRKIESTALATDDHHIVTPSPDSRPTCQRPRDELIDAAKQAVPTILAPIHDTRSDPDACRNSEGVIRIMACELVKRLCEHGHPTDAAEWAIHELVMDGVFVAGGPMESGPQRWSENALRYLHGATLRSTGKLWTADNTPCAEAAKAKCSATDARNEWIYNEAVKGVTWHKIATDLKKKPRTWALVAADGCRKIAARYAKKNKLPPPPNRKQGRPTKKSKK
ncbi:MAG: hypothetical protein ABFC54_09935 [Thermoguttaceae bacterium]